MRAAEQALASRHAQNLNRIQSMDALPTLASLPELQDRRHSMPAGADATQRRSRPPPQHAPAQQESAPDGDAAAGVALRLCCDTFWERVMTGSAPEEYMSQASQIPIRLGIDSARGRSLGSAWPFMTPALCMPGCSGDMLCCPADLNGLSASPKAVHRSQRVQNRSADAPPAKMGASAGQRPRIRSNALQAKAGSACQQVQHCLLFGGDPLSVL